MLRRICYRINGNPRLPQIGVLVAICLAAACKIELPHGDLVPPAIQSVVPADAAVDVSVHDGIAVAFSEPMDTASAEGAFSLSDGTAIVTGTFSWSGDIMSFDPGGCLSHGTTYKVKVTTSSQDTGGNHLESEFIAHFSTPAADPQLLGA